MFYAFSCQNTFMTFMNEPLTERGEFVILKIFSFVDASFLRENTRIISIKTNDKYNQWKIAVVSLSLVAKDFDSQNKKLPQFLEFSGQWDYWKWNSKDFQVQPISEIIQKMRQYSNTSISSTSIIFNFQLCLVPWSMKNNWLPNAHGKKFIKKCLCFLSSLH